jgi:hypothetical protein
MKNPEVPSATLSRSAWPRAYRQGWATWVQPQWICHGSVACRPLFRKQQGRRVRYGPYYVWTSKERGKTVCLALSKPQYEALKEAIGNYRRLQKTLTRLQGITLKTILRTNSSVRKRTPRKPLE